MKRYRFSYFVAEGLKNIFRHGLMSWSSILTLMLSLFAMGTFILFALNINYNVSKIDLFNEIVAFADLDTTDEENEAILKKIEALPQVESVKFVSKEESLELEKKRYGEEFAYLFENYGDDKNPLPDSFEIEYSTSGDVDVLIYNIEEIDGIESTRNRKDISEDIARLKKIVYVVSIWLSVILIVVSLFVIMNTIKNAVYARKGDIELMRLIGATNYFISMPFVIEGFIIGLISSALALLLEVYAYNYIVDEVVSDYGIVSAIPLDSILVYIVSGFALAGVLFSIIVSAFTARRYMKG